MGSCASHNPKYLCFIAKIYPDPYRYIKFYTDGYSLFKENGSRIDFETFERTFSLSYRVQGDSPRLVRLWLQEWNKSQPLNIPVYSVNVYMPFTNLI